MHDVMQTVNLNCYNRLFEEKKWIEFILISDFCWNYDKYFPKFCEVTLRDKLDFNKSFWNEMLQLKKGPEECLIKRFHDWMEANFLYIFLGSFYNLFYNDFYNSFIPKHENSCSLKHLKWSGLRANCLSWKIHLKIQKLYFCQT